MLALLLTLPASATEIDALTPPIGGRELELVLHGTGFTGTTEVNFMLLPSYPFNIPATFTVESDTTLRVRVPDCGGRAGVSAIGVVSPSGATISASPAVAKIVQTAVTGSGAEFGSLLVVKAGGS